VQQAHIDAIGAYTNMLNQGTGTPLGPQLTGQILTPGLYSFTSAADLAGNGTLILNDPTGTGIFVFNVDTSLTANVGSSVIGTANPCNVYWRVGTSATLNGNAFFGTVIADQSVTVSSANHLFGRAVGVNAAVTMPGAGGNTIGGCAAAVVVPPPGGVNCPPGGLTANGESGTATVTLSAPAPVGGTLVILTSSAPDTASVPISVLVPAGETSVTFTVTPGATPGNATITATTSGGTAFCTLTVGAAVVTPGEAAGGPTLDSFGLSILLVLLAVAGVLAVNRFAS